MNPFEIGDKVVYPNHGVGIIEKISNRLVAGKFERFYLLRICSNDILVMVPTANAGDVGLRKIIERKDVDQLITYLTNSDFFSARDWKDRFKENSERMRSGSVFHVAEVFTGSPGKLVSIQDTIKGFKGLCAGDYDHLPEQAFYLVGTIDEAVAKAEKLAEAA